MTEIKTFTRGAYTIGSCLDLSDRQIEQMTGLFTDPPGTAGPMLGGRRPVRFAEIDDIGPAAVKSYARGGIVRHFNTQHYLRLGKTRCRLEFEHIQHARSVGINAPEPIAFAHRGTLLYRAWLVTRELKAQDTLASLSMTDENRARDIMKKVTEHIMILVRNRILHVDMHPGNVLVTTDNTIFLVDFDKARTFRGKEAGLRRRYVSRWQRAVTKHGLPEMLAETFVQGLLGD